jgi:MYXO-CTERM domain-containing protein
MRAGTCPTTDGAATTGDAEFTTFEEDGSDGNFDAIGGDEKDDGGCGCRHEAPGGGAWLLGLGGLLLARRRRR